MKNAQLKAVYLVLTLFVTFLPYKAFAQIRVGLLYSLTGTMAVNERTLLDIAVNTFNEINISGGINGKTIEVVIRDTGSNWEYAKSMARELIEKEKVSVIFGCWTSACRKAIKPIVESNKSILFYSVQYEGVENSDNIVYTGELPNQQVVPAMRWVLSKYKPRKVLIIGSDYIYPKIVSEIIKSELINAGVKSYTELYIPLGSVNFKNLREELKKKKFDLIINTLNGSSNVEFFRILNRMGFSSKDLPSLSFSVNRHNLGPLKMKEIKGHYLAWSFFEEVKNTKLNLVVERFKLKTGYDVFTSSMMSTYTSIKLWEGLVKKLKTANASDLNKIIKGRHYINGRNISIKDRHLYHDLFIGKITSGKAIKIVWKTKKSIPPVTHLKVKSKKQWNQLLDRYFTAWNQNWNASEKIVGKKFKKQINIYASRDLPYLRMDLSKYNDYGILGNLINKVFYAMEFNVNYINFPKNRVVNSLVKERHIAYLPLSECDNFSSEVIIVKALGVGKLKSTKIEKQMYAFNQNSKFLFKYYKKLKNLNTIKLNLNQQLMKMLYSERVEGVFIDENTFYYLVGLESRYAFKFTFDFKKSKKVEYGICFSDKGMRDKFNQIYESYTDVEPIQFSVPTWRK